MLTILPETPGLIAFEIDGRIDTADMERAIAHTNERLAQSRTVSVLVLVRRFGFVTPPALLKDLRYGVERLRDLSRFRRVAVVTDSMPLKALANVEGAVMPKIEMKTFALADEDLARLWLAKAADEQPAPGPSDSH